MTETELDRMIDRAAAEMVSRQPGRTLHHSVMARVRESDPPPRRFVWAIAGFGAAACVIVALVIAERTPAPPIQTAAPARPTIVEQPAATVDQGVRKLESATQAALPVTRRRAPLRLPPDDLSTIEAITPEPLVVTSIDLPLLENQAASVDRVEIEELTIEPLTALND